MEKRFMNSRVLKTSIGILIFLLMLLSSVALMKPVYKKIDSAVRSAEKKIVGAVEEKSGFKISYKSLSPAILSKIYAKGIVVSDAATGEEILRIKKISVSYSVLNFLKGDPDNSLKKFSASDVDVNLDFSAFSSAGKTEKKSVNFSAEQIEPLIQKFAFKIPCDVQLKNLKFNFSRKTDAFAILIRNVSLKKNSQYVHYKLGGQFSAEVKTFGYRTAGFLFGLDGYLVKDVSGSFCRLMLDDYSAAQFSVKHLEFLTSYKNQKIFFRTTQNNFPFGIFAEFDLAQMNLSADLKMQNFDPLQTVRASSYKKAIKKFQGTTFSTDSQFTLDAKNFRYEWQSKTSAELTKRISKKGQSVSLSAVGNNTDVNVEFLRAEGEFFQGTFEGNFYIPKLQPSGYLNLEYYAFHLNGNKMSAEIYFDPRKDRGFDFFIPQLYFGDYCFYTAFQGYATLGREIELIVEASDYSHAESGEPGRIYASGNLQLGKNKYLQASAEVKNFFVETGIKTGAFFAERNGRDVLKKVTQISEPYICNVEAYFATDFKSYTYNSPMVLVANTKTDREALLVSFDGSGTTVQFSSIDFYHGSNSLSASGGFDVRVKKRNMTFFADMNFNSLPYSFSGDYDFGDWMTITGSYGLDVAVNFKNYIDGFLKLKNFPVALNGFVLDATLDSSFSFPSKGEWSFILDEFEISELSHKFRLDPKIRVQGIFDEKSFVASNVLYSDSASSLEGDGYVMWNFGGGIFEGANVSLNLKNNSSAEKISLQGNLTNPLLLNFSAENLKRDFYFSAGCDIFEFPVSRFLAGQKKDNTISASLNASGTFENPYLSMDVKNSSVWFGGANLFANLNCSLVEKVFEITGGNLEWRNFCVSAISALMDFNSFDGSAKIESSASLAETDMETVLNLKMENLSDDAEKIPDSFSLDVEVSDFKSEFVKNFVPLKISLIRSPGRFDIATDENLGAFGEILDGGKISFFVGEDKPFHFALDGTFKNKIVNLNFGGIYLDAGKIFGAFNSDLISVYSAIVEGALNVSGNITDPNLNGRLSVSSVDFNLPQYVSDRIRTDEITVELSQEEISVPETVFKIRDGRLAFNALAVLDHWKLDSLQINASTYEDEDIPVDAKVSHFRVAGFASADASVLVEDGSVSLNGSVGLRNTNLSLSLNPAESQQKKKKSAKSNLDFSVNLDVLVGKKVQVEINPLLRSLIAPSTPISVSADTSTGLWNVKGDIVLRGGEVSYLSRNFYLKQGRLILDETQNKFDPVVTVRAETREHDSNGEPITISLSAISQNVSRFNAVLSSSPAKSEKEIMDILGQIVKGDSSSVSGLLVAGVDYGVNATVLRKIEGALRDLWNFDIFSVRTTILQNSLMQGLNINSKSENDSVIGNLFNNSTVYIGKYFGSDIYADALLHWSYDSAKANSGDGTGSGLVFQLEIGLEFAAPFANIRWNFAPDLGEFKQSWTQATSITLSWRISF
jgi:hypothetical protein